MNVLFRKATTANRECNPGTILKKSYKFVSYGDGRRGEIEVPLEEKTSDSEPFLLDRTLSCGCGCTWCKRKCQRMVGGN